MPQPIGANIPAQAKGYVKFPMEGNNPVLPVEPGFVQPSFPVVAESHVQPVFSLDPKIITQQGFPPGQHPAKISPQVIYPDISKLLQIGNLLNPSDRPVGKKIVIVNPINEDLKSGIFSLHKGGLNGGFHTACGKKWVKGPYTQAFGENKTIPFGTAKKVPVAGELLEKGISEVVLSAGPQARSDKYIIENGVFNDALYIEDLKKCFLAVANVIEYPANTQLYFPVMGGGIFNQRGITDKIPVLPPKKMAELQRNAYEQAWNENRNFALMQPVIMIFHKDEGYVQSFPEEFKKATLNPIKLSNLDNYQGQVGQALELTHSYKSYQPPEEIPVEISSSEDSREEIHRYTEMGMMGRNRTQNPQSWSSNDNMKNFGGIPSAPSYTNPRPDGYSKWENAGKTSPQNLHPRNRSQERE